MNVEALKSLGHFCCTEQYHRFNLLFPRHVASDGAMFLAKNADCFWLLEAIASAQILPAIRGDSMLRQMQFWTLKKGANGGAELICERDSGDVAYRQSIPYTDFPFDVVTNPRIWVAPTMLNEKVHLVSYLPGEH